MALPTIPSRPTVVANGLTYYVDSAIGNDGNTSTQAQDEATPWATIGTSIGKMSAGDTLMVKPGAGQYARTVVPTITGASDAWFRIIGVYENGWPSVEGFLLDHDTVHYAEFSGFDLVSDTKPGFEVRNANTNLYLHDMDADGSAVTSGVSAGFQLGYDVTGENDAAYVYMERCTAHGYFTNANGFIFYAGVSHLTLVSCVSHDNGGDGFGGYSAPTSSYLKTNGYFVDCIARDNAGDGFDLGFGVECVFLRCISTNNAEIQGVGFKCWGGGSGVSAVWLQDCQSYNNGYYGLETPNWADTTFYIDGCYFGDNAGPCIRTIWERNAILMGVPTLHITNSIMYCTSATQGAYEFENSNTIVAVADNNTIIGTGNIEMVRQRFEGGSIANTLTYASMPENVNKVDVGYASAEMEANSVIYCELDGQTEAPGQIKPYPVVRLYQGVPVSIDMAAGYWSFGDTYTGTMPYGLALNSAGLLTGTPTGVAGSDAFTITATNSDGARTSKTITASLTPSLSNFASSVVDGGTDISCDATSADGLLYYVVQEAPIPGASDEEKTRHIINQATGVIDPPVVGANSVTITGQEIGAVEHVGWVQAI